MGYACPVCDADQADAAHLANHLAITASLGREEHREWLEEHAPDWGDRNPDELGKIVAEHAPEIETPEFEGGPGHDHGHDHSHDPGRPKGIDGFEDGLARQSRGPGRGALTSEAESVLQEARELTRRMQEGGGDAGVDGQRESDAEHRHESEGGSDTADGDRDGGDA
ncbi:DUF5810 domain-containing protein [Halobiforma nitratireducens]|uniref:Uncharacterized protein n=1 Tax=Halobiforma nitratireducens JCM 10879 TaxID=1227454 RepID=M0LFW5_9EURY|nr:DUF5810 domain-containing protein [Halobiforma nitratireducens]EMA32431.1 hypothetical protein C446_15014 [Halobiforma nitratireducens JCM 10879]